MDISEQMTHLEKMRYLNAIAGIFNLTGGASPAPFNALTPKQAEQIADYVRKIHSVVDRFVPMPEI